MAKTVENVFMLENALGYRWGVWMWLCFFIPSVGVMFAESDVSGEARDFLVNTNLLSCLSLLYFNYFFWAGVPASSPSVHVLSAETAARLLLVSYYGMDNIVGTGMENNALYSWNWVQVIVGYVFGVGKFFQTMYILWNRREYMAYEEEQKEKMI